MFLFLLLAMVVVVGAVTLAVVGGGDRAVLLDTAPECLTDPLPVNRPLVTADLEKLRLPMAVRGYRMADVDEALDRVAAELAERDARIADLESALSGALSRGTPASDFRKPPSGQEPGHDDGGAR
ncbi:DivIVA domain-containing protein [Streptomyces sp. NPDC005576]|uniref:DivIVA domain-containing protein n=1 Tax=unclassified Streptomyces TaxID=2593676 RepID=UPI003408A53E